MRALLSTLFFLALAATARAQTGDRELFGDAGETKPRRAAFVLGVAGGIDLPGADLAERFGPSFRIGPSVHYQSPNGWIIGLKADFIFGSRIREDSLLINVRREGATFFDDAGQLTGAGINQRGYTIGVYGGKAVPFSAASRHSALLTLGGGFIQHKINFYNQQESIAQLRAPYDAGYDRLTNGLYTEAFAGYAYTPGSGYFSAVLGFNFLAGFTAGRRDYLFDVQRSDAGVQRLDLLYGLRAAFLVPLRRRASEDIYFD